VHSRRGDDHSTHEAGISELLSSQSDNLAISMAAGAFGSGSIVIIGLLMSGLEGNKIASRAGEEKQEGDNE
jgi:hypothetical protein